MRRLTVSTFLILLAGCASGPYGLISTSTTFAETQMNVHEVQIRAVDGRFNRVEPVRLAPGVHTIVAESQKEKVGRRPIIEQAFTFEVKPCKHYYIAARHDTPLQDEGWEPIVTDVRDIVNCEAD